MLEGGSVVETSGASCWKSLCNFADIIGAFILVA